MEQFIARKADILFCPSWKTTTPQEEEHEEADDAAGAFRSLSTCSVSSTLAEQQLQSLFSARYWI